MKWKMYELEAAQYDTVAPLFQPMDCHLAVRAVMEGTVPARVYADHPIRPRSALVWAKHRFYLAGSQDNAQFNDAIHRFFVETVYPQALESRQEGFALYYAPESWEDKIGGLLGEKRLIQRQRQYYAFRELKNDWRALLPQGVTLAFVDEALLEQKHLANLEDLVEEICSERPSVEEFLEKSFGVCLIDGDELAGWCLSEYNVASRCEVGIGTVEPYRRRGFATAMASALIEHALSQGVFQIGWHCYVRNDASVATARKVGFEKVQDYAVFVCLL